MNNNNFLLTINSILYSIHTGGWVEGGRRGRGVGRGGYGEVATVGKP